MNCYFTCRKLSKFSKNVLYYHERNCMAPFNLAHPVGLYVASKFSYKLAVFAARCYMYCVSAAYAVVRCLAGCLSCLRIASKRLKIRS